MQYDIFAVTNEMTLSHSERQMQLAINQLYQCIMYINGNRLFAAMNIKAYNDQNTCKLCDMDGAT